MDNTSQQTTTNPVPETPVIPESASQGNGYYKKGSWKKWLMIYFVIGAVAYGLFYYFYFYKNNSNPYSSNTSYSTLSVSPTVMQAETASWKTYVDNTYFFSLKYPEGTQTKKKQSKWRLYSKHSASCLLRSTKNRNINLC